tara:strand:+ start:225 stop:761 length:537 start_codon:yes stop_codon:yes gene_type:complete
MKAASLRSLADTFTLARLILGFPIILALSFNNYSIAWIFILIGGFSDIADGIIAREADGGSPLGAKLDPLADKIMLSAPFIWLASIGQLPIWSIWLLISRELLISSWRSENKRGGPASLTGKSKTILQFLTILMMLWPSTWGNILFIQKVRLLGSLLFWPSLILALISGYNYILLKKD